MRNVTRPIASAARLGSVAIFALVVLLVLATPSEAQERAGFRRLAPGVMTTIAADHQEEETFGTHDLVEIRAREDLRWDPPPHYTMDAETLRPIQGADILVV